MIEQEHYECTQADIEEQKFLEECRKWLREADLRPLPEFPVKRATPRKQPTHRLEYSTLLKQYYVVPIVPQYERGD